MKNMGHYDNHFCIFPLDNEFMPTDDQYLEVLQFYLDIGLIKKSMDVLKQEGRCKVRALCPTGNKIEYADTIVLPEEFYLYYSRNTSLNSFETRKELFDWCYKPIKEIINDHEFYESKLLLSDDFLSFLSENGFTEFLKLVRIRIQNGIYKDVGIPSKSILLDMIFDDYHVFEDREGAMVYDSSQYVSLFRLKFNEIGLLDGLKDIIGIECNVAYFSDNSIGWGIS